MKRLHKWALLVLILIAALACYMLGFGKGAVGFVIMGVLLEMVFWFTAFSSDKKSLKSN